MALITYTDEFNVRQTQLAVVGDNTVHLLESRALGVSQVTTPVGTASSWLRDGIFKFLNRKVK